MLVKLTPDVNFQLINIATNEKNANYRNPVFDDAEK